MMLTPYTRGAVIMSNDDQNQERMLGSSQYTEIPHEQPVEQ